MSKFGIFLTDLFAETLKVEFRQMRGFANRRFDFQVSPSNGKMAMCDSVMQRPQKSGCGIFFFIKTTSMDHGAYGGQRRTRPPCCSSLVVP